MYYRDCRCTSTEVLHYICTICIRDCRCTSTEVLHYICNIVDVHQLRYYIIYVLEIVDVHIHTKGDQIP